MNRIHEHKRDVTKAKRWVKRFFEQLESHGLHMDEFAREAGLSLVELHNWMRDYGKDFGRPEGGFKNQWQTVK